MPFIQHKFRSVLAVLFLSLTLGLSTVSDRANAHGISSFPGGVIAGIVVGSFLGHAHRHHHHHSHRKYRKKRVKSRRYVKEVGYQHRHCKGSRCTWHWHSMRRKPHRRH